MTKPAAATVAVLFTLAVFAGASLSNDDGAEDEPAFSAATSSTSTTPPRSVFVSPNETVIGPVAIVAKEPRIASSQLVIDFDIKGLAPLADAASVTKYAGFGSIQVVPPEDLDSVYLDTWSIRTADGSEIPGRVANPAARAARFEVGDSFDLSAVEEIVVVSYAVLTPIEAAISLGPGSETAAVAPGLTARLLAVTEQANTIIQVELASTREFNLDAIGVAGAGPGWLSAVRESEGRPRWNLTYDSPTAPASIDLIVSGSIWLGVDGPIPVRAEDLP